MTDEPNILIPKELLSDLMQVCNWMIMTASSRPIPPSVLELWQEQAKLVQAWAEEYTTQTIASQTEGDK